MKKLLVLLLCCAGSAVALAQAVPQAPPRSEKPVAKSASPLLANHDSSKPVNIEANELKADLNSKTVTYTGNVIATQGDIKLRADTMKDDSPDNKIYAGGKVVVDSPASGTATGDNAVYDLTKKLVTLSGHVVLNKPGQATMRGSLLTVNMVTGIATVNARPVAATPGQVAAPGLPGGRVQGIFTPKSAPDSKTPDSNAPAGN